MPITDGGTIVNAKFIWDDKDFNEVLLKGFYIHKMDKKPLYQLLYALEGEYQIINFWGEKSSINVWVSKQVIIAYLTGRNKD